MNALPEHLDPETLAAFAEGRLDAGMRDAAIAHLDRCDDCMNDVALLLPAEAEAQRRRFGREAAPSFRGWSIVLAAAAMLAIVLLAMPLIRQRPRPDANGIARLVELAPRSARTVEARLSGGFVWAPYRGRMRASDEAIDPRQLRLHGAAGEVVEHADAQPSGEAQRAAGVALLLIDDPQGAIARLRDATLRAPRDAQAWSDLAAAQYGAALRLDRPSLFPEALASADRALRLDPAFGEALFNRALVLERMGLTRQAREAWNLYLQHDPGSAWATEARTHLKGLPATTGEDLFRREQPRFESAVGSGDTAGAAQFVDHYRQQSRAFAEAEYLGLWGEAAARRDPAEEARLLALARATGNALAALSGETLLRDAVASIDDAPAARRASIAEAHRLYRRGRLAFSRHQPAVAEPDLRRAATLFAMEADPMSLVARYYAASAGFDRGQVTDARAELDGLLAEALRRPGARALAAQVRWQLSLCLMLNGDWQGTLSHVEAARAGFERGGERSNLAFMEGLLADTLINLGRADESWAARIRAFSMQSEEGRGDRLAVNVDGAARMELRSGRPEAAHALVVVAEEINRAAHNDVLLADTLVREAVLNQALGDLEGAAQKSAEARFVAQRISDPAMRARALNDAGFAAGSLLVQSDPRRAAEILGRAIDGYRSMEKPFFLPECHLLRGRAGRNIGDDSAAAADFDRGIDALERHRVHFAGPVVGSGVFDARTALFHEAMQLQLDHGQIAAALAYAERSRAQVVSARETFSLQALQAQLAGSESAVLELVALPGEIAGFVIGERELTVKRSRVARPALLALASRMAADDDAAARELYDILIRPHERELAPTKRLIIVPDRTLGDIPFAALLDATTKQRLLERMTVATASDAASLRPSGVSAAQRSIVAVSLPADGRDALPETRGEINGIAGLYGSSTSIPAEHATFAAVVDAAQHANVIHIAGHTERQPGPGDAALVFEDERISWHAAAAVRLRPRTVVVLAACETLRIPPQSQTFSLSLGDGFLAAGAGDVIGTLYPIPDNEARTLFDAVHRQLAAQAGAAEAVRHAQLEALAAGGRTQAWRSLTLLTRHIGV
jgi:CHAT domain-containing protein